MDETARVPGTALGGIQGGLLRLAIRRKLGRSRRASRCCGITRLSSRT